MKIRDVIAYLDSQYPRSYAEDFDNTGLLVGEPDAPLRGILVAHDAVEPVIDEAAREGRNLVVAFHPIIFKGLKKITGADYVERAVMKALRLGIAVYSPHTAVDNHHLGVSDATARALGLQNRRVLMPKSGTMRLLVTYAPHAHAAAVREALWAAGAGRIGNYDRCSFNVEGYGTFRPLEGADPFVGRPGTDRTEAETRISVVFPAHLAGAVESALLAAHPYEEPAYEIYRLENRHKEIGIGTIGEWAEPLDEKDFLERLKQVLQVPVIRHSALRGRPVRRVAIVGGSGAFAIEAARAAGADAFVSGDFKYHDFFKAENQILLADAGHYETERFVSELLAERLSEKFPNFAVSVARTPTNPVHYYK